MGAFVPLGFAASYGTRMAVRVRMHGAGLCEMGDGGMLGIEVVGCNGETRRTIQVLFSPRSGRCIIMNLMSSIDLVAQVMPELAGVSDDGQLSGVEVEAWVSVSEHGGICFHRRRSPADAVEQSGELSRRALPIWAADYLASVAFQVDALPASIDVTVTGASSELPPSMACHEQEFEMDVMAFRHVKTSGPALGSGTSCGP